jgi:hypothetical protein
MGQVLSCETGLIPRCRSHSVEEKATSSHGEWLAWEEILVPTATIDLDRAVHRRAFRPATPGVESRSLIALSLA